MRPIVVMLLCGMLLVGALSGCDAGPAPTSTPPAPPASATPVPSATPTKEWPALPFSLTSTAFGPNAPIPRLYTCDGRDASPPLQWNDPPPGTRSFALIMDDPDAPGGIWVHWVLYNLPAEARSLPEAVPPDAARPDGSRHGKNSWGKPGYGGPCPPAGTHRYVFKLYALDVMLNLAAGANKAQLLQAMEGHVLAQAELMGTYAR